MIISRTLVIWALFWENRISSKLAVISTSSEEGRTSYSIKEIRTNFMQIMGKYWENIRGEQRSQYQSWLIFCVNLRTGTQIFLHLKKTTNRHSYRAVSPYWSLLNNIHNIHKSRTMHNVHISHIKSHLTSTKVQLWAHSCTTRQSHVGSTCPSFELSFKSIDLFSLQKDKESLCWPGERIKVHCWWLAIRSLHNSFLFDTWISLSCYMDLSKLIHVSF